jgi:hypothetical protein
MEGTTMKKVYLKPAIEILEEELTQMLCSSTVINPDDPNKPAGAREFGGGDILDSKVESLPRSGSAWDE